MGIGNTVMIFGLGDLGGWVLEFLARRNGVSTIIGCDKRTDWGSRKVNVAAVGAGAEGYDKTLNEEAWLIQTELRN
jgi:prephenate dehydrogenase